MQQKGFDYVAYVAPADWGEPVAGVSRADRARHGFGLNRENSTPFNLDVLGYDPNTDIRAGLTSLERSRYDEVLHGDGTAEESATPVAPTNAHNQPQDREGLSDRALGCNGTAVRDFLTSRGYPLSEDGAQKEELLLERLTVLEERLDADSRLLGPARAYTDCMAQAGYSAVDVRGEAEFEVARQTAMLFGYQFEDLGAYGYSVETITNGRRPPPPEDAEVEAIRELELHMAVSDFDCRAPFEWERSALRRAYEEAFVIENRQLIEEILAS